MRDDRRPGERERERSHHILGYSAFCSPTWRSSSTSHRLTSTRLRRRAGEKLYNETRTRVPDTYAARMVRNAYHPCRLRPGVHDAAKRREDAASICRASKSMVMNACGARVRILRQITWWILGIRGFIIV